MPGEASPGDDGPYPPAYFAAVGAGSLASARAVLREAFRLLGTPETVLDVGCGTGTWLRAAAELGAGAVLGIDGEWVPRDRLEIPADRFVPCDLALDGVPARTGVSGPFDLVLSLEVGEHLPGARADAFAAELCGFARDAVLFSAAVPFQGGEGHLNEAWPMAWAELFAARGFRCFDALRPLVWLSPEVDWWYAQNALLFARGAAEERLERAAPPFPAALPLVHPRRWLAQGEVEARLRAELEDARREAERARAELARLAGKEAARGGSRPWRATTAARRVAGLLLRRSGLP